MSFMIAIPFELFFKGDLLTLSPSFWLREVYSLVGLDARTLLLLHAASLAAIVVAAQLVVSTVTGVASHFAIRSL